MRAMLPTQPIPKIDNALNILYNIGTLIVSDLHWIKKPGLRPRRFFYFSCFRLGFINGHRKH